MNLYTKVEFGKKARSKMLKGLNIMADAVGTTLGPRGRNVAIEKSTPAGDTWDRVVIHDGVNVARSIELKDHFENMGAYLIREASQKQVDEVGDGTTLVMVLAQGIVNEAMQLVDSGINPMGLRKSLEERSKMLTRKIEKIAVPIKGLEELKFIANISAGDDYLGNLVAETRHKVGKEGVITVEESKEAETTVEHQEGMQLEKGWLDEYFITNPRRREAVLENPYILLTDKPINTLLGFEKFFEELLPVSKNLVIISPDISGTALPLLINHNINNRLNCICIQAPSMGEDQKGILQDIAILTGAKFISEAAGYKFEDLKVADLGQAESVTSYKETTIIVGGKGTKEAVKDRVSFIEKSLETTDGEFNKTRLRARLGKLTSGVSVIRVGGHTKVEMNERRERTLDAVAATKAAMEKGIVPGGEIIFLHIRNILTTQPDRVQTQTDSYVDGILYRALYKPFQKLITNAGLDEIELAIKLQNQPVDIGVDVTTGEVKDLLKAGIVDPALVSIQAIKNAISVAIQIITTDAIVVPENIDKK